QTAIQEESYKKADIESYEYIAEPSACPICGALNGKIFKLKDMSPGINAPNMHPFCRCSTAPHVDDKGFWDDLLDRKVISQDEYKQAFDDRTEADKAIEELRRKRKG
ncbi:phage head morphogenesis protein, partial [Lactococcus lactis]